MKISWWQKTTGNLDRHSMVGILFNGLETVFVDENNIKFPNCWIGVCGIADSTTFEKTIVNFRS